MFYSHYSQQDFKKRDKVAQVSLVSGQMAGAIAHYSSAEIEFNAICMAPPCKVTFSSTKIKWAWAWSRDDNEEQDAEKPKCSGGLYSGHKNQVEFQKGISMHIYLCNGGHLGTQYLLNVTGGFIMLRNASTSIETVVNWQNAAYEMDFEEGFIVPMFESTF